MAVAFAEALGASRTVRNIAYAADVLGTFDYLKDKGRMAYRRYKKRWGMKRKRSMPYTYARAKRRRIVRAKRRAKIRKIGWHPGSGTTKRFELLTPQQVLFGTKLAYSESLVDIPKGTNNEIDRRQRDMANIRGFKMCMEFTNLFTTSPLDVRWAIVVDRKQDVPDATFDTTTYNTFFRGGGTERHKAFPQTGTLLNHLELMTRNINTDQFLIVKGGLIRLAPKDPDNGRGFSYMLKKYVPLKRQVRYNSAGYPNPQMWLIWWCDEPGNVGTASTPSACQITQYQTVYFREPKC